MVWKMGKYLIPIYLLILCKLQVVEKDLKCDCEQYAPITGQMLFGPCFLPFTGKQKSTQFLLNQFSFLSNISDQILQVKQEPEAVIYQTRFSVPCRIKKS